MIAALNGIAFGGGLELAATADLRVAEEHARVGLPETRIGIVPGWSGTQRLVRRAGAPARSSGWCFTGEPVDAAEALRLGLVDYVVPKGEGLARARELAATIARAGAGRGADRQAAGQCRRGRGRGRPPWKRWPAPWPPRPRMRSEGVGRFREKRQAEFGAGSAADLPRLPMSDCA